MEVMHKWPHRASVPDVWLILLSVFWDPFFFMHAITGDTDGPVRIKIVLDMIPWSRSQSGLGFYLWMDGQKWTENVQKQFCLKERLYQCYFMPYNSMVRCTSCVTKLWMEITFKLLNLSWYCQYSLKFFQKKFDQILACQSGTPHVSFNKVPGRILSFWIKKEYFRPKSIWQDLIARS